MLAPVSISQTRAWMSGRASQMVRVAREMLNWRATELREASGSARAVRMASEDEENAEDAEVSEERGGEEGEGAEGGEDRETPLWRAVPAGAA
ncbi:MAG: hypothetical protein KF902_11880 [Phycisphaeraceae bacterium]|nr:hypothetical protein [Phycisphaeraceae bacterium]